MILSMPNINIEVTKELHQSLRLYALDNNLTIKASVQRAIQEMIVRSWPRPNGAVKLESVVVSLDKERRSIYSEEPD